MGNLQVLQEERPDTTHNEYLLKAAAAAGRISTMIHFTKEYEQIGVNVPVWQDIHTIIEIAMKEAPLGKIKAINDIPAGSDVFADPLIVRVFYNLMENAVRHGGKITTIRFSARKTGKEYLILCEDDGDGIPPDDKDRIFERGFGKNTGFGLFLSREILDITGIAITETGGPGEGARFEITVPAGMYR